MRTPSDTPSDPPSDPPTDSPARSSGSARRPTPSRPATVWALLAVLVLQAVSAVGGGVALVAGPRGEVTGLPLSYLEGSPFDDYLVPGLILLLVLGVLPAVVAAGCGAAAAGPGTRASRWVAAW